MQVNLTNSTNIVQFHQVNIGDTFLYDDMAYMRTRGVSESMLAYNCVCLKTGFLYVMRNSDKVQLIQLQVTNI